MLLKPLQDKLREVCGPSLLTLFFWLVHVDALDLSVAFVIVRRNLRDIA